MELPALGELFVVLDPSSLHIEAIFGSLKAATDFAWTDEMVIRARLVPITLEKKDSPRAITSTIR